MTDADFLKKYGRILQAIKSQIQKECPEADVLIRYFKSELGEQKQAEVAQHLEMCPVCMQALQGLAEVEKAGEEIELPRKWDEIARKMDARVYAYLESLKTPVLTREPDKRKGIRILDKLRNFWGSADIFVLARRLAYLGLALSLGLGVLYAYALLSRPDDFSLAQIAAESRMVVRGEGIKSEMLQLGMQAFAQGKYENAVEHLGRYLTNHPNHFQANYTMGLAYLLDARVELLGVGYRFDSQKVRRGIEYLEKALSLAGDNAFYREDCLWYLGKASLMLGDRQQAQHYFEQIINLPQPNLLRKEAARKIVRKIPLRG